MATQTLTKSVDYTTAAGSRWDGFRWTIDGRSDLALAITWTGLDNTGGDGISMRMAYPIYDTDYLDWIDGTELSTTSANPAVTTTSADIAYSDLPADKTYYVEFLKHSGAVSATGAQVIARGRITVQHSNWQNT